MKANINRVVSRLEDIYQCGKKEDGTYTRMAFSEEDVKKRTFCILGKAPWHDMPCGRSW